jgi:DNA-binding phage protein
VTKAVKTEIFKKQRNIGRHTRRNRKMSHRLRHHDELVIDELRNPEMAKSYLEVALEEYEQDGDLPFFLQALRNVVEAQGGIAKLASNRLKSAEPLSSLV